MFIPPIYDEIGDGLLLFYHHYTFHKWCDSVLIIGISGHNSIAQVMAKHVENYVLNMPQQWNPGIKIAHWWSCFPVIISIYCWYTLVLGNVQWTKYIKLWQSSGIGGTQFSDNPIVGLGTVIVGNFNTTKLGFIQQDK